MRIILRSLPFVALALRHRALGFMAFMFLFSPRLQADPEYGYGYVENKNQWPQPIDYMMSIPGGKMTLQPGRFSYFFFEYDKVNQRHTHTHHGWLDERTPVSEDPTVRARRVNVDFLGANPEAKPVAMEPSITYFNYFLGNDPTKWAGRAHAFNRVEYTDWYAGVRLSLSVQGDAVKYTFVVEPQADPAQILLAYSGAQALVLKNGDLRMDAELAMVIEKAPSSYQIIDGVRREVPTQYDLEENQLRFVFPQGYDPCYELIIDPLLIFSTYSGVRADNWGVSATPGERATLYSSGTINTTGGRWDASPGSFQPLFGGGSFDVVLFKYDSLGQQLLYASHLGGSNSETPHSLLVNHRDQLLILGTTGSSDFPATANAYKSSFTPGGPSVQPLNIPFPNGSDIFITRVSADGATLLSSTYLGGDNLDGLNLWLAVNYGDEMRGDIVVDKDDNVFIASLTASANLATQNAFSNVYSGGGSDALVARLSPDLDRLEWAGLLGGSLGDAAYSIRLNQQEDTLYVSGGTSSGDFPVTSGAYLTTAPPTADVMGWIAKMPVDGSSLRAATFIAATRYAQAYFIDLDNEGNLYAYGQKHGRLTTTSGVYVNPNSGQFLQKYSPNLDQLIYSTTFGSGRGAIDISPTAFLVNGECGNIYMAGWGGAQNRYAEFTTGQSLRDYAILSSTRGMPVTRDAFQPTTSGSDFYLIALSERADRLLYATFMGGRQSLTHVDGGTSRFDKRGIVYHAVCAGCGGFRADFPATPGAWSLTNNSPNCNNLAFKFDLSVLRAIIATNSISRDRPGIQSVCFPDKIIFDNQSIGGVSYVWDFGDGVMTTKTVKDETEYQYATPGQYRVTLTAMDQQTCKSQDVDQVTIDVHAATGRAINDRAVCEGQSITLEASGGVKYDWSLLESGDPVSSESQTTVMPEKDTQYHVAITNNYGCLKEDTVSIAVTPAVDVQFDVFKTSPCNERPVVEIVNRTVADAHVVFDLGDGNTSEANKFSHEYAHDGYYSITATADRRSCSYTKDQAVPVFTVGAPNVITPSDSPGKNDTFKVLYGEAPSASQNAKVSLRVYNRWGLVVFEDSDYKNDWLAARLEPGVYYYEVKVNDERSCKDWLHVIK